MDSLSSLSKVTNDTFNSAYSMDVLTLDFYDYHFLWIQSVALCPTVILKCVFPCLSLPPGQVGKRNCKYIEHLVLEALCQAIISLSAHWAGWCFHCTHEETKPQKFKSFAQVMKLISVEVRIWAQTWLTSALPFFWRLHLHFNGVNSY